MRINVSNIAVLLAGSLLAGCNESEPAAKAPRPVRSVVAQAQALGELIAQTGEIRARYETPLGFRIAGELRSRIDVGRSVKAGDIVATIDPVPARNEVRSATAEVDVAQAALALAEQTAERIQELFSRTVATRVQVQDAEANLRTTRARLDLARSNLAKATEALGYTELKAPYDGAAASTAANAGQNVGAGQTVLTLVSADQRGAVFDVPERLISDSSLGNPVVEIGLISDPSIRASGKVREVAPVSDPSTRAFRVRVALERGAEAMPLGAAVVGQISLADKRLYLLPASALTRLGRSRRS